MKTTTQTLFVAILSGLLNLAVTACVPGGEVSGDVNGETGDAFVDAIPTAQMLSLSTDEGTVSQGLTVEQGLTGEPSEIRAHAERVREGLNRLRAETHARIDRIVGEGEMTELTLERATCKRWDLDGEQSHWQLTSCKAEARQDGGAIGHRFVLRGKPLGADDDAYLPVFAGRGAKLPAEDGQRRGAGQVGYNFDHIATLTGADVAGKLGIGYRAGGRARQLNMGMKDLQGPNMEKAHTGRYQFKHAVGRGGQFRFMTGADLVTLDEAGEPARGQDGVDERLRAGIVWNGQGRARTAAAICGGTLGERCIHRHQCWERGGEVAFEDESSDAAGPSWEPTACGQMPEDLDAAPGEDEVTLPEGDDDLGAPSMEEPYQSEFE